MYAGGRHYQVFKNKIGADVCHDRVAPDVMFSEAPRLIEVMYAVRVPHSDTEFEIK